MPLTPRQAQRLAEQVRDAGAPEVEALPQRTGRIGGYRILRLIGSGGMGSVYEAEQDHPRRIVALKVLDRGPGSTSRLRRFRYEVDILGRLRHPGIAQVYEAGTHRDDAGSIAFFAMELVPGGRPITHYAVEHDLGTTRRIELFAAVCDAVQHGHLNGVVHRDLKPANLLVDESGRPKVIDFGVARATDSDVAVTTLCTEVGALIGTLQYMSPEQCDGDPAGIDTRSDVYSLGVVLYELLCGQLPYDLADTSIAHAVRVIQQHEPRRPSAVLRTLRRDLEAIVLKALEKNRERRYQSAGELAGDVRRYLAGDPVEARTPTAWRRAVHWIGRHPVWSTAALCLAMAAVTVTATWLAVWWLAARPYQIMTAPDGREARLLSIDGRTLHTWDSKVENGITYAGLIDRPQNRGGGKVVILGFDSRAPITERGALCAYDPAAPDTPLWTQRVAGDDLAGSPLRPSFTAGQFFVAGAQEIDVLPDRPGTEIVAIHKDGPSSPVALRVYGLDGELLYQLWHDGSLNPPRWMPGAGMLVVSGLNSEVPWYQRDGTDTEAAGSMPPLIIFAVRPKGGHIAHEWTTSPGGDTETLAWYRCVLPPAASAILGGLKLIPVHPGEDSLRQIRVTVSLSEQTEASFSWLLDETGAFVPGSVVPNDQYRFLLRRGEAPDPASFQLGGLPPRRPDPTQ